MISNNQNLIYSVKSLTKKFNSRVIFKDLNFNIYEGDFITLIGKSGSGKTTLLNVIGLLDFKFEGSLWFFGENIENKRRIQNLRSKEIGYLFQSFYLLDYLNVKENILLPFKYLNELPDMKYFEILCKQLGIENILESHCNVLSGGEKQRVSLARALIKKPKLLICDEPTGNLDKENKENVISLLKKINTEYSTTILIVTHDDVIASKGNRRFELSGGTVYEKN